MSYNEHILHRSRVGTLTADHRLHFQFIDSSYSASGMVCKGNTTGQLSFNPLVPLPHTRGLHH